MSKDYNFEIGYESLQKEWQLQCKRTPKGVSLVKGGKNIYLQFKTPNKSRSKYRCACSFSVDGMHEAVRKSHLVKAKLTSLTSETEFWEWYDKEIEEKSKLIDDRLTFDEAIKKVEDDFWSRPSRTKRKRDKNSHSDQSSWHRTYGCFYQHLPNAKAVNFVDMKAVIDKQKKGTRNYKYVVTAMKKITRLIKREDLYEELDSLNVTQTEHADLQTVTLEDFLRWRKVAIGETVTLDARANVEGRRAWLWAFSVQVVYGLRLSEVFAIKNLTEPYATKDGVLIPPLSDTENTTNLIYIGSETNLKTTVKTGARIARPIIPPKYPNLIEMLNIKTPLVPTNKPKSKDPLRTNKFFTRMGAQRLVQWNAPFTQTHALRHLANINGMQAGIPLEVRAQSMGHTPAMNDSVYKKRQSTQTTIDLLLNSNTNAIDFVTALAEAKKIVKEDESNKEIIARMLSIIYQKDQKQIDELL